MRKKYQKFLRLQIIPQFFAEFFAIVNFSLFLHPHLTSFWNAWYHKHRRKQSEGRYVISSWNLSILFRKEIVLRLHKILQMKGFLICMLEYQNFSSLDCWILRLFAGSRKIYDEGHEGRSQTGLHLEDGIGSAPSFRY